MAVAGKVAITLSTENGGAWSSDATYDRLVAVKHNNNLYISRKTVANVEPPNDEFWFLALEGFGGDDVESILQAIENIINGTTQVGNAKTLDGHGAEYFVERGEALNTSILEKAVTLDTGMHNFVLGGSGYTGEDLPSTQYAYGIATVNKRGSNGITVLLWATRYVLPLIYNQYNGAKWSGWKEVFTTDGGTVKGTTVVPIAVDTSSADNQTFFKFLNKGVLLGYLGFDGANNPVYLDNTGNTSNVKSLLHTGNKPTGTYTGNGSATSRTVNVGGVGEALLISNSIKGIAIVTSDGAFGVGADGNPVHIPSAECKFVSGVLTTATTNALVNADSYGYKYISI